MKELLILFQKELIDFNFLFKFIDFNWEKIYFLSFYKSNKFSDPEWLIQYNK
jgi:hypothetical protein